MGFTPSNDIAVRSDRLKAQSLTVMFFGYSTRIASDPKSVKLHHSMSILPEMGIQPRLAVIMYNPHLRDLNVQFLTTRSSARSAFIPKTRSVNVQFSMRPPLVSSR